MYIHMTVREASVDEALQVAIESFRRPNEESERAERDRIVAEMCNEPDDIPEEEDEDADSDDDSDEDEE